MYVVVIGNIREGIERIVGPFPDENEGYEFLELLDSTTMICGWVMEVQAP